MGWFQKALCLVCVCCRFTSGYSFEDELRNALHKDYNPMSLPAPITNVTVNFTVTDFNINEVDQTLDMNLWMQFKWRDPRLEWDANKFPKVRVLAYDPATVWKPDFYLYNNADTAHFEVFAQTKVLAMADKGMVWVPPAFIRSQCVIDVKYWPYDTQTCEAKFGSWVYSAEQMMVKPGSNQVKFEDVASSSHTTVNNKPIRRGWIASENHIKVVSKIYDCCPEEYISISLFITLQRSQPLFCWLVGVPCVALGLLSLIVFMLPPTANEKILLGGFVFVAELFVLISVSKLIGHSPNETPLIVQMISWQLILTTITLIVSVKVLRMAREPFSGAFSQKFLSVAKKIGPIVGLQSYIDNVEQPAMDTDSMSQGYKGAKEKSLLMAAFIDRMCVIVFAFTLIVFLFRFPIFS